MKPDNVTTGEGRRTCNGQDFKKFVQAGLAWLEQNYEEVNALNVFPVPDGDTGTNMMLTMRSAYNEIAGLDEPHLGTIAQKVYNGALMGARGNSGVILSQLWRGFARGVEEEAVLRADSLVRGLKEATRMAYQAVQEPVEGTMLTVAREAAEEAEAALEESSDLPTILERVVERCHLAVQRTPQLLPVLAEAGVVDSGGRGLTFILEGMLRLLRGEPLEIRTAEHTIEALRSELSPEDEEGYGYDVQYLIKGEGLDVAAIRRHIESLGWSTLVVGDSNMIKVHVHVHNPGEVIGYGASQGVLLDVVVENMQEQYQQFVQERGGPRMASQQSAEPVRAEQPTIEEGTIAAVAVAPGDGLERIFYSLGAAKVISGGQTMNPSMKDILEAVNSLPTDRVVILPNNKNIFMAAEQAAQAANGKQVHVVPTRTIPQGISALLALDPHGEFEEVVEMMTESSEMVETGEVTVSTRTARVDGVQVRKGQIIGLHNDKLTVAGDDVQSVVLDLLDKMGADDLELITLYDGDSVTRQEAVEMAGIIQEAYPDHEVELREGGQPHYFYILSVE